MKHVDEVAKCLSLLNAGPIGVARFLRRVELVAGQSLASDQHLGRDARRSLDAR
jgi:hypothetical protein